MNERAQRYYETTRGALDALSAYFRLFASLLLLAWVLPSATYGQPVSGNTTAQSSFAASQPIEHSTIIARDVARQAGAEAFRFKSGAYVPLIEGNGKPLGIVPDADLPLEYVSDISPFEWLNDWSMLLTSRAFDARGPPSGLA